SIKVFKLCFRYRGLWLPAQAAVRAMSSSGGPTSPYTSLAISRPAESITHVELHRPEKLNAMNKAFWREMVECFTEISEDPDCRVVVVSGAGKIFTAGIDLTSVASNVLQPGGDDIGRVSWNIRNILLEYQDTFSVIEKVRNTSGSCVDLITACDIRLCTQDAWFQVKEVDIGLAADVGTLQRLPKHRVDLLQAVWNMSMLQSQDVMKSAMAAMEKKSPKEVVFSKL
uniref:Enoyl CoA hydratase 1, peroxisomal n=1 Tax=Acanthochromis polyacanthus TaxID=80966 RepID=A0A3Q1F8S0_9TELE